MPLRIISHLFLADRQFLYLMFFYPYYRSNRSVSNAASTVTQVSLTQRDNLVQKRRAH